MVEVEEDSRKYKYFLYFHLQPSKI